jgi:pyruvate dehydrogenase E2 component (dihydrolipoamide acetyltransferase)
MSIELKMPALSPTMEEGTLAKWLVSIGDAVKPGDVIAEIETDKATMEFEAIDEGRIVKILVDEGTDGVAVGTVIALLADSEEAAPDGPVCAVEPTSVITVPAEIGESAVSSVAEPEPDPSAPQPSPDPTVAGNISPLAMRLARLENIDLASVSGSGPAGRIVRKDLGLAVAIPMRTEPVTQSRIEIRPDPFSQSVPDLPHELVKMTGMRKTIARRLTESKQQVPHIYLSVDVQLDALLSLRAQLNEHAATRGQKLSVNDMIIKALAIALIDVPACNVQLAGEHYAQFDRADISVAVSIPGGLITPVIASADTKSLLAIAAEMKELAERARAGKLQPHEFQGGTASLSNLGMFGIKQFAAVINPPQAMIMAVGVAEQRPHVQDGILSVATIMTVTGSFDHRVIDGADAAAFMQAFQRVLEIPLQLL